MRGQRLVTVVVAAAWMLVGAGIAGAQLSTFAGRQVGDGRVATAASLSRPFGVEFLPDGTLLIADRLHHRIRRVDAATNVITTIAGGEPGTGGNAMVADQAELAEPVRVHRVAASGDLLITNVEGHEVRRIAALTGIISRIAGSPTGGPGSTGDGGPATAALLNGPTDATPDAAGNILIADRLNHRIRRIDAGTGVITTVAGTGVPGFSPAPTAATLAQLNSPNSVLPIPAGGFFICDEQNHVIRRVDALGTITTVAGTGTAGFADGPVATAQFNAPVFVAFGDVAQQLLLVADRLNNRIRQINLGTGQVTTIAGDGTNQSGPDGGPAASTPISRPAAVTLAPDGRIVFAEDAGNRVRAIDGSGNLTTIAGDGIASFGGDGGPKGDAQFGQVKAVFRDRLGNFLIADSGNNRIRRVVFATGVVDTVAGTGDPMFSGDGGLALDAGLTVSDVVEDAAGNIVFSDTDNHRIRRIDVSGVVSTIAGTGAPGFAGDNGPAAAAQLSGPTGLALDDAGNLFVADAGNSVIRRIDTAGNIVTVAGVPGPPAAFNGDDIPATTATLASPTDIEVDEAGNIFIADFDHHRVRRVDAATGNISTVAGSGVVGSTGDGGPATAARLFHPTDVKLDETGALWLTDTGNNRLRRFTVGGAIQAVAGSGERGYAGDGGDPLLGRLLVPVRLLVLSSSSVLIAERDNYVVRLVGQVTFVPPDCTGDGAARCVAGGGKASADCATEFKMPAAGGSATAFSCIDGDESCDIDGTTGQCTIRIALCLNNQDPRLSCSPSAITSLKLNGNQARSRGAETLVAGLGGLAPTTPLAKGVGVTFNAAFGATNECTPVGDFTILRKKKKGKGKLGAVTSTTTSGKDKDKLKLTCLPPP